MLELRNDYYELHHARVKKWLNVLKPLSHYNHMYWSNYTVHFLQVWVNAASQNFNSIGIAFGSMIAFASYNKFNNNIVLDTWAISITNSITSLLAGTIVFSTLGNIALEQGKSIDDVVAEGKKGCLYFALNKGRYCSTQDQILSLIVI